MQRRNTGLAVEQIHKLALVKLSFFHHHLSEFIRMNSVVGTCYDAGTICTPCTNVKEPSPDKHILRGLVNIGMYILKRLSLQL